MQLGCCIPWLIYPGCLLDQGYEGIILIPDFKEF
jgi:hypothetical protein